MRGTLAISLVIATAITIGTATLGSRRFLGRSDSMTHFDESKCDNLYTKKHEFSLLLKETTECIRRRYETLKNQEDVEANLQELEGLMQIAEPLDDYHSQDSSNENGCSTNEAINTFRLIDHLLLKNEQYFNIRAYLKYHKGIQLTRCRSYLNDQVRLRLISFKEHNEIQHDVLGEIYSRIAKLSRNNANFNQITFTVQPNWTQVSIKNAAVAGLDTLWAHGELGTSCKEASKSLFEQVYFSNLLGSMLGSHCSRMLEWLEPHLTNLQRFIELFDDPHNLGLHEGTQVWLALKNYCKLVIDQAKQQEFLKYAYESYKRRNFFGYLGTKINSAFLNCLTGSTEEQRSSIKEYKATPISMRPLAIDHNEPLALEQHQQYKSKAPITKP